VFHGLQELGLSIDEVRIEPLQSESKGLFGIGAKLARVRLTQRDPDEASAKRFTPDEDAEFAPRPDRRNDRPQFERRDDRSNERSDRPVRNDRPQSSDRPERNDRPQSGDRPPYSKPQGGGRPQSSARPQNDGRSERPERAEQNEPAIPQEHYDYSAELAQTHPAGVFLKGLLACMNIDADLQAAEVEDGVRVSIQSKTKGLLIGRRGETLDAMQYLTSLVVNRSRKQDKYLRVTLDTEDYRNKREDTLIRLARRQAARVKSTGRPVAMEPMNPYERRVLHASLQNNPFVTTHSEGEEPNRRVVITPKK
jgi:spoIIIJ-associated protein